jgi:pyruvate/2-oxoglutarate/acetoin dehydrogenase E1 component
MRVISVAEALNEALKEEMRRNPLVFAIGEDIGRMGGLFRVTSGLADEFGTHRVIDTPISEAAIAGAASERPSWAHGL